MSRNDWRIAGLAGALLVAWAGLRDWQSGGAVTREVRTLFALDSASQSAPLAGEEGNPPNIVVIVADDLSVAHYDAALSGLHAALGGVELSRFYVSDPLCCPSRSGFFRGQFTHNHQVLGNKDNGGVGGWPAYEPLEPDSLPVWLQAQGYETTLAGKYLNEAPAMHVPPGWSRWRAYISNAYESFNMVINRDGAVVTYEPEVHEEQVIRGLAAEAIATATEPFFLYLAPVAPHEPAIPEQAHAGSHQTAPLPGSAASLNEADVSDKPAWLAGKPLLTQQQLDDMVALHRNQLESSESIGDLVTTVQQALVSRGVDERTWVIFWSDNGYHVGEHRLTKGKRTLYEEDVRVPAIIRPPSPSPATTSDVLVSSVDLTCSVLDIAGAPRPGVADCVSAVPVVSGGDGRVAALVEHYLAFGNDVPTAKAVIWGDLKLIRQEVSGEIELYDLAADPGEVSSLHADPLRQGDIARLTAALDELATCAGLGCIYREPVFADGFETGDASWWSAVAP